MKNQFLFWVMELVIWKACMFCPHTHIILLYNSVWRKQENFHRKTNVHLVVHRFCMVWCKLDTRSVVSLLLLCNLNFKKEGEKFANSRPWNVVKFAVSNMPGCPSDAISRGSSTWSVSRQSWLGPSQDLECCCHWWSCNSGWKVSKWANVDFA